MEKKIEFDQMINEFDYSWIHISYVQDNNRNQVLEAYKKGKKTAYKILPNNIKTL